MSLIVYVSQTTQFNGVFYLNKVFLRCRNGEANLAYTTTNLHRI